MAQYDGTVLTNDGINLLAKCQLGQKIEFTKVLIGDGRVPEGKTFQEMTALVNTKLALGIQSVDFVEDGRVDVTAIIDNSGLEVGFFVREIGLFAKPVDGAEILYAYTNAGDYADYLPNAKVNEVTDQIAVQSIITNKENVVININDNFVVATKADLKKHDESVNVHVNLMNAHNTDEGAHEPAFTAHNADTNSHTDIRNKIDTDISSHNTSTSAHTDIRNKIQTVQQNASLFMLPVKRKTTYAVGDCASATGLPSWAYLECVTAGTTDESEPDFSGVTSGDKVTYGTAVFIIRKIGSLSGFNIGDIKWSSADLTQAGFLIANGAEVGRATYPDLCAVYEAMGFPWGAGDGSATFNLPNLIGKFPEGADSAGGYKEAGLPNITGMHGFETAYADGAFLFDNKISKPGGISSAESSTDFMIHFDASRSNPIYGNSDTVQPNSALLIPYVKAFAGASADSTDLAISEVANDVARISEKISKRVYLVESVVNKDGSWYRKYSDGWLEQGGVMSGLTVASSNAHYKKTVTLLKPYADTNYVVSFGYFMEANGSAYFTYFPSSLSTTNFVYEYGNSGLSTQSWYACGMGAE